MSNLTNWSKDSEGRLTNTFEFKNYRKSLAFTCEVAMLSEKKNHHPQIIKSFFESSYLGQRQIYLFGVLGIRDEK